MGTLYGASFGYFLARFMGQARVGEPMRAVIWRDPDMVIYSIFIATCIGLLAGLCIDIILAIRKRSPTNRQGWTTASLLLFIWAILFVLYLLLPTVYYLH